MGFVELTSRDGDRRLDLTIARAERMNGLGTAIASELLAAVAGIKARRPEPRVLVIRAVPVAARAGRIWIGGGDLKELAGLADREAAGEYAGAMSRCAAALAEAPFPVIVAVDGDAIGGGAELALAGDLRFAAAGSRLVFKQLQIGLPTGYGSTQRLIDLVGLARAQAILLLSQTLSDREAMALGLFHGLAADPADLAATVDACADAIIALEPAAVRGQKRLLAQSAVLHPGSRRAAELREFTQVWGNPTHKGTLARFASGPAGPGPADTATPAPNAVKMRQSE